MDLTELVDLLADRVAARVVERLAAAPSAARVYLSEAVAAGAPSAKWLRAQARSGRIALHGARGRQFVFANELAALLEGATARRAPVRRRAPNADVVNIREAAANHAAKILKGAA